MKKYSITICEDGLQPEMWAVETAADVFKVLQRAARFSQFPTRAEIAEHECVNDCDICAYGSVKEVAAMRLWHYELIPYLPNKQLLGQWRELNSIFRKQDKHILINYVYDYNKEHLRVYACAVLDEMMRRGFKVSSMDNMARYFGDKTLFAARADIHYPEHNERYLRQCFYNLQEKFERGQKDFTCEQYTALVDFCFKKKNIGY